MNNRFFLGTLLLLSIFSFGQMGKYKNVYVDFSGGLSSRIGKIEYKDVREKKYKEELKRGLGIDFTLYVRGSENAFIGFKYTNFSKKVATYGYIQNDFGNYNTIKVSDDVRISFYGLTYLYSNLSGGDNEFNLETGLGYVSFRDDVVIQQPFSIKGGTLGLFLGTNYYIKLTDNLSFGPKVSLLFGSIGKFDVSGNTPQGFNLDLKGERESISKIDLALALRVKL